MLKGVYQILSGGQTGVDRAALDFAQRVGLAYGGWCPKGGWAEDAPTPPGVRTAYPLLKETPDTDPQQRTAWNVRDADATLVLADPAALSRSAGTAFTLDCARRLGKPLLLLDPAQPGAIRRLDKWLAGREAPLRLNIAGPRTSEGPALYAEARALLEAWAKTAAPLTRSS